MIATKMPLNSTVTSENPLSSELMIKVAREFPISVASVVLLILLIGRKIYEHFNKKPPISDDQLEQITTQVCKNLRWTFKLPSDETDSQKYEGKSDENGVKNLNV